MIYKVCAVEKSTGFSFEEDCDSVREAQEMIGELRTEGYGRFQIYEYCFVGSVALRRQLKISFK
jgi:hypothetical protein